jgi:hypothetical protein
MTLPITLIAIDTDPVSHPLTRHAVHRTLGALDVEEVLFFGGATIGLGERFVRTERFDSIDTYSEFVFKCLWPFVRTEFVMIVHWDGFAVAPELWEADFLAHDYIGAPWAWATDGLNIGNGGFCIRSRKLMLACRDVRVRRHPEIPFGGAEDIVIGRIYRSFLEAQGITFAPVPLAHRFSYETGVRTAPSFGFHGPDNMPLFLSEDELLSIASPLAQKIRPGHVREKFLAHCDAQGYARVRAIFSAAEAA